MRAPFPPPHLPMVQSCLTPWMQVGLGLGLGGATALRRAGRNTSPLFQSRLVALSSWEACFAPHGSGLGKCSCPEEGL